METLLGLFWFLYLQTVCCCLWFTFSHEFEIVLSLALPWLCVRGVQTADVDIHGPGSADFLADADGLRIRQTNTFADADHPRI